MKQKPKQKLHHRFIYDIVLEGGYAHTVHEIVETPRLEVNLQPGDEVPVRKEDINPTAISPHELLSCRVERVTRRNPNTTKRPFYIVYVTPTDKKYECGKILSKKVKGLRQEFKRPTWDPNENNGGDWWLER